MDTSEICIKMCKKAKEIQENWNPQWGDWLGYVHSNSLLMVASSWTEGPNITKDRVGTEWCKLNKGSCVWLPRQDQLQEMLGILYNNFCDRNLGRFCGWIGTTGGPDKFYNVKYKMQFTSMEQLWLAFVMKEKYNKTWNGKEWERL